MIKLILNNQGFLKNRMISKLKNYFLCLFFIFISLPISFAQSWEQLGADIDGEAEVDFSGYSVSFAADDHIVAMGAHRNDENGINSGHTRIYQPWAQLGSDVTAEAAGDNSGNSVSISTDGKSVVIDATLNDELVTNAGNERVYKFINTNPSITSFSPESGPIGTEVTITGTNFNAIPANNIVFFGATKATVSAATATSLTVTVPSGATYAPITVLNTGTSLAAYSIQNFTPKYSPAKTGLSAIDFSPKQDFTTSANPRSVAIGDLDGDGKSDLVVANFSGNTISVYRNTSTSGTIGLGSFAAPVDYVTGTSANPYPISVSIGDLDGDGKPDLVVSNQYIY
jgi:hypothetical protein